MNSKSGDIDPLLHCLEAMAKDPSDDEANRRFADCHAGEVAALLEELKAWRENAETRQSGGGRVIVEGYDEESMKAAFADALNKASAFFDEHHDISLTVLSLDKLLEGGRRVTMQVDITPLTWRDKSKPDDLRESVLDHRNRVFKQKKNDERHMLDMVHEHFLEMTGTAPHVPDYFLINFKEADLLNHMIEREFFKAGHKRSDGPVPPQAIVRVIKPDQEN